MTGPAPLRWEVANDPEEVHALLCACDRHQATPAAPAPERGEQRTRDLVAQGAVHILRAADGRGLAMFTLTWAPPSDTTDLAYPAAQQPAYMSRLAVQPDLLERGTVLGAQCYRHAFELAAAGGADVLRVAANPDIHGVFQLLGLLGFEQCGATRFDGRRGQAFLEKAITGQ